MRTITSDHVPTIEETRAEEANFEHAVKVHGLTYTRCPFCGGMGCNRCGYDGVLWSWQLHRRCGETCPLRFPTN